MVCFRFGLHRLVDDNGVGDIYRELRLLDVGSDTREFDLTLDDRLLELVASSGFSCRPGTSEERPCRRYTNDFPSLRSSG